MNMQVILVVAAIVIITAIASGSFVYLYLSYAIGLAQRELQKEGKMYVKVDGVWYPRNPHRIPEVKE